MIYIKTIEQFDSYFHQDNLHKSVSVAELYRISYTISEPVTFSMYALIYFDELFGEFSRAGKRVNYTPHSLIWLKPGDSVVMRADYAKKPRGWIMAFSEELLERSGLGRDFYMFTFFNNYPISTLSLTNEQKSAVISSFVNIQTELLQPRDYLTNHMLRLSISQLLTHYKRFFERSHSLSNEAEGQLAAKMGVMLENYLSSGLPEQKGYPTVAWLAGEFGLTANYFGDLVRRELHISAQEFIHNKMLEVAERLLLQTDKSITQIALQMGFSYPTHFVRMFKRRTGESPLRFRRRGATAAIC